MANSLTLCFKNSSCFQPSRVYHPSSGRVLKMFTDQPGVQFYTGNGLDGSPGKGGVEYHKYGAFCLEAQNYPDAINQVSLSTNKTKLNRDISVYYCAKNMLFISWHFVEFFLKEDSLSKFPFDGIFWNFPKYFAQQEKVNQFLSISFSSLAFLVEWFTFWKFINLQIF